MSLQYLAGSSSFWVANESFLTQPGHFAAGGYVSPQGSSIMEGGHTHVAGTSCQWQVAPQGCGLSGTSNRRNRCRRTSRACWRSAWLPLWPLAVSRKKKNSSSWSPSPFRWSRPTPANTNNIGAGPIAGRVAPGLVPSTPAAALLRRPPLHRMTPSGRRMSGCETRTARSLRAGGEVWSC